MEIRKVAELPLEALQPLVTQSKQAGWRHLERLRDDWASGSNRFDAVGEGLFVGWSGEVLVAVGGVNRDLSSDAGVARLRRLYVDEGYRGRGWGGLLVRHLLEHARICFREVRVGAGSAAASAFFESMGFERSATHSAFTHTFELGGAAEANR